MNKPNDPQNSLQEQVSQGISSAQTLLQGLLDERRALAQGIEGVRTEFISIREQVASLVKLIYHGGDGRASVVTQLALIQKQLDDVDKDLCDLKQHTSVKFSELSMLETKKKDRNLQLFINLFTGGGVAFYIFSKILDILNQK